MATVQGLYLALFGRPADPRGLDFYNNLTNNGRDLQFLSSIAGQPEYLDRFQGMNEAGIVNSIYLSLFGRPAEPEGLAYYADKLARGQLSIENVAVNILDGAKNQDLVVVENKLIAADMFTRSLDTPEEVLAYVGPAAAAKGQAFLATITSDPSTIPTAREVDDAVIDLVTSTPPGGGGVSVHIELVAGAETRVGSSSNDLFEGALGTLDDGDDLNGEGGLDILKVALDGGVVAPKLTSIEELDVTVDGSAGIDLGNSDSSIERITLRGSGSDQVGFGALDTDIRVRNEGFEGAVLLAYKENAFAGSSDEVKIDFVSTGFANLSVLKQTGANTAVETLRIGSYGTENMVGFVQTNSGIESTSGDIETDLADNRSGAPIGRIVVDGTSRITLIFSEDAIIAGQRIERGNLPTDVLLKVDGAPIDQPDQVDATASARTISFANFSGVDLYAMNTPDQAFTADRTLVGIERVREVLIGGDLGDGANFSFNTTGGTLDSQFGINLYGSTSGAGSTIDIQNVVRLDIYSDGPELINSASITGNFLELIHVSGPVDLVVDVSTIAGVEVFAANMLGDLTLTTGLGDNTIWAGEGLDTLTGGSGQDTFVVLKEGAGTYQIDVVTDFDAADDFLDFNDVAADVANARVAAEQATDYASALAIAETYLDGTIKYVAVDNGADTWVFYDELGDSNPDAIVRLAGVSDANAITPSNLVA
ncbi:DUF4214 domain-containing protein [Devosia sp. 919]|uniref:DUF4214 domain-containing protein n=1 Tax=Devosia sp. 919 TaxID=2726065 RepID=UPI0015544B6C|nr:DUF4214 domain-containing protein [Devosia sp. 919]